MTRQLFDREADLIYEYLPEECSSKDNIQTDAYHFALKKFKQVTPGKYDLLEDAANNPDTSFAWENITIIFETRIEQDVIHPATGVQWPDDQEYFLDDTEELREVAREFGWQYIECIREEIRSMQEETNFSPEEFTALILDANINIPESKAADLMNISIHNFRAKKETTTEKLSNAQSTLTLANDLDTLKN